MVRDTTHTSPSVLMASLFTSLTFSKVFHGKVKRQIWFRLLCQTKTTSSRLVQSPTRIVPRKASREKSIDRALWKAEGFVKSSSVDTTPSTRIDVDEDEEEILRTGVGEEQQQLVVFFFNDTADAAEEGQETRNFARENMLRASRFFLPFCAAKKESKVSNCFSFPRTKRLHHPLLNERLEGRHERRRRRRRRRPLAMLHRKTIQTTKSVSHPPPRTTTTTTTREQTPRKKKKKKSSLRFHLDDKDEKSSEKEQHRRDSLLSSVFFHRLHAMQQHLTFDLQYRAIEILVPVLTLRKF